MPAFRALHGNEHVSGKSCLEWEILRDVRVHGSSCGPCCDVLHSPLLGSTIVATAAVGTTCFASADCTVSRLQGAARVLRLDVVVMEVSLLLVHTILFETA